MPVNFINQFGGLLIIMKNRIFGLVMASVLTVSAFCGCGASMTAADADQKGGSVPENAANAAAYSHAPHCAQYSRKRKVLPIQRTL